MRAAVRSIVLEPDPATLSGDPAEFCLLARISVGPADADGAEMFDVTVCTPGWLAASCWRAGGSYNARHHLVTTFNDFDQRALQVWISARVQEAEADTWPEIAERLARAGH